VESLIASGVEFNRLIAPYQHETVQWVLSFLGHQSLNGFVCLFILWFFDQKLGKKLIIYTLIGYIISTVIKEGIGLPRPINYDSTLSVFGSPKGATFPSGRAWIAAMFWGYLFLYFEKKWVKYYCVGMIGLVGLARVYLGVHFYFDVIVGWLLGLVMIGTFSMLEEKVRFLFYGFKDWRKSLVLILSPFTLFFISGGHNHVERTICTLVGVMIAVHISEKGLVAMNRSSITERLLATFFGLIILSLSRFLIGVNHALACVSMIVLVPLLISLYPGLFLKIKKLLQSALAK